MKFNHFGRGNSGSSTRMLLEQTFMKNSVFVFTKILKIRQDYLKF